MIVQLTEASSPQEGGVGFLKGVTEQGVMVTVAGNHEVCAKVREALEAGVDAAINVDSESILRVEDHRTAS